MRLKFCDQPTNEQGDSMSRIITATLTILLMTTLRSAPSSIRSPTPDTISVSAQEGQSAFTSTPDQTIKKDFWDTIVILDTLVECTSWNPILDTTQQHWFKTNKHCFRYYDIFTFCNPYNLSRESFYSGSWRLIFDTNCQKNGFAEPTWSIGQLHVSRQSNQEFPQQNLSRCTIAAILGLFISLIGWTCHNACHTGRVDNCPFLWVL